MIRINYIRISTNNYHNFLDYIKTNGNKIFVYADDLCIYFADDIRNKCIMIGKSKKYNTFKYIKKYDKNK